MREEVLLINARDNQDETPLHRAVALRPPKREHTPGAKKLLIKLLIDSGADMQAKNVGGQTPLEKAYQLLEKNNYPIAFLNKNNHPIPTAVLEAHDSINTYITEIIELLEQEESK